MFSPAVLWLFRLVHILSGVFWVGGVLLFAHFLFPTARALGPTAGPVMDHLNRIRRMPQTLLSAGGANILSGFGLLWHDSAGFQGTWMASTMGITLSTGGLLAVIALGIGLTINAPTAQKLGAMGAAVQAQGTPPAPEQVAEMQRLQRRLGAALSAVATLLVLATAAMALARYL